MVCPPYPELHPLQMTRSTAACSTRRRTACSTATRAGCARRHHSWGSVPRRTARRWARVRLLRIPRPTHSVPACKHDPCACDSSTGRLVLRKRRMVFSVLHTMKPFFCQRGCRKASDCVVVRTQVTNKQHPPPVHTPSHVSLRSHHRLSSHVGVHCTYQRFDNHV